MKLKIAISATLLALLGSTSVQAAVIQVTLNPASVTAPAPSSMLGVDATLLDTGPNPINIGTISVSSGSALDATITDTNGFDEFVAFDGTLQPGVPVDIEATYGVPAFDVLFSGNSATDSFNIFVGVAATTDPPGTYSGTAVLQVNATPEPGNLALFLTCSLAGSFSLLRRRK